jgi:hypothetical protein
MYHDGDQWRKWECYNSKQNNIAILVGGGPSLNSIDVSQLTGPGKTVFGLNTTYPAVRPDIWIGMDDPKCYNRKVFYEPFPKIMRGNYYDRDCDGVPLLDLPNIYFASIEEFQHKGDIFYKIGPDTEKFIWDKNVFVTALNLILYMGYRKIYLAGVDFSIFEGDYFHNNIKLSPKYKRWNQNLYEHLYKYTEWFASTGEMCGIEVASISPGSKINNFLPYISLEELNRSIKLPDTNTIIHCGELDKIDEPTLVSKEYKKVLEKEHNNSIWGVMAGNMIQTLEKFLLDNNAKEVLDYGSGSSSFKNNLSLKNINVYEYDPGVPGKDISPDPRDYTICIDVLEHIEPTLIDNVLQDLARVTKIQGYFTIAMYPASRILSDGRNAHLIVESFSWWVEKLCKYFNIITLSEVNKQLYVQVSSKSNDYHPKNKS